MTWNPKSMILVSNLLRQASHIVAGLRQCVADRNPASRKLTINTMIWIHLHQNNFDTKSMILVSKLLLQASHTVA